ncbi:MAG: hypothetical protein QOF85_969 [Solirubrobacterales bacterium]|jgi:hypothetical protein|nr:hypothetical protein [Solirubrobacterales bacterium]
MKLGLVEFEEIAAFLEARSPAGSARDIASWCGARDVDSQDVLYFARALTRSCLETIAAAENRTGEPPPASAVEAAIAAAIVTALQIGVDSERRRRDARELPR